MTHVAFLVGEPEYGSHVSMRTIERDLLARPEWRVTYSVADNLTDDPDVPLTRFPELETAVGADVVVIYTRWRQLPDEQMRLLAEYLERGGAIVGLRTSSHAFRFDSESRWAGWNSGFGRDVLGTPWVDHHGHSSRTIVTRIPGVEHPILDGVDDRFEVRSFLYHTQRSKPCTLLLHGEPVDPECPPVPGPVAWTTEHNGGRVFYTSLGHLADFEVTSFRRLLVNGIAWCAWRDSA